jgi:hypothetical protein
MPNDVTYSEEESRYVHEDSNIMKSKRRFFALTMHDEKAIIDVFQKMIVTVNEEEHVIASMSTGNAYSQSAEKLSRIWRIGISSVKRTLEATMQKGVRTVAYPSVEGNGHQGSDLYIISDFVIKCSMIPSNCVLNP